MEIVMPQLGETVAEGEVILWCKEIGEQVKKGETLFEISTDKVTMEVPSVENGILVKKYAQVGEVVGVGLPVATLQLEGETLQAERKTLPDLQKEQLAVSQLEPVKTSYSGLRSPAVKYLCKHNDVVLDDIQGTGNGGRITKKDILQWLSVNKTRDDASDTLSPAVRRLLAEHNINATDINGTGKNGRVNKQDVLNYIDNASANPSPVLNSETQDNAESLPEIKEAEPNSEFETVILFNHMRKMIAHQMTKSVNEAVHVSQGIDVCFDAVERVRLKCKDEFKVKYGCSLTPLSFIARAVCIALTEFPHLNAKVEEQTLITSRDIHLGIAVDLAHQGLVVPVIRNADDYNVSGLAKQIAQLATKARNNELDGGDLQGGTYTLSNNGVYGTAFTTPIINVPQVAILSVDAISRKPVVVDRDGQELVGISSQGMLTQSFDHRAVDGGYSGAFLNRVAEIMIHHPWQDEVAI
ncbi:2-oxo acid dehydrogenases acyltransferase (Catalytic domain) protein [Vibrio nigripulchritudo SOn1]|uniref:Dihydrolipoamide acetyltransferase component of pyruvate dehydrogenase complex n=1 Tax=Vibrio nigripulchritudo SOn1 TaxID=1238450 RepID=A0AAV2VTF6_9VIBR|nr:dihydrolipoamide acetyltransferase family protein [Vibrio nigripulchritudo]CCO47876.1 2-oxo acid dehydrogenases acyltransferase (Catalytic domain) protein [Vibrio nigripulchritudo SOn1]